MAGARSPPGRDGVNSLGVEIFTGGAELGLGLLLRRLRLFSRHDEVRQIEVERDTGKSLVESCFGNALRLGLGPKIIGKPNLKLCFNFGF